ncbi:hypothetical protein WN51_08992 [Melipona quadrifasciata]|uniref:Uncharacterized protein n=1 Tax=Melipona quadrifasciata TaxID=166423 RepID=A0A0N0BK47_9HYME|nr:hypothetical protein WN51_08992 [Melipona quadrifasciata]
MRVLRYPSRNHAKAAAKNFAVARRRAKDESHLLIPYRFHSKYEQRVLEGMLVYLSLFSTPTVCVCGFRGVDWMLRAQIEQLIASIYRALSNHKFPVLPHFKSNGFRCRSMSTNIFRFASLQQPTP